MSLTRTDRNFIKERRFFKTLYRQQGLFTEKTNLQIGLTIQSISDFNLKQSVSSSTFKTHFLQPLCFNSNQIKPFFKTWQKIKYIE